MKALAISVFVCMTNKSSVLGSLPKRVCRVLLVTAALCLPYGQTAQAADDHSGHSDDLLLLIQTKLQLRTLQQAYSDTANDGRQRQENLKKQLSLLRNGMKRLQHYVAISSGHYANDALYQQSLENRAALLHEFAERQWVFQQQWGLEYAHPLNPDEDQHIHGKH